MDDQDISNFSTSSSHRLPTVSASQALRSISPRSKWIPTGLSRLDHALKGESKMMPSSFGPGGIPRGNVTETYGPPGVGKTSFAMRIAANALQAGDSVVWIDTGPPIAGPRLKEMVSSYLSQDDEDLPSSPPETRSLAELLGNFLHFQVHTMPHLLALIIHPPNGFPPNGTSLIVIDSISSLFTSTFPRNSEYNFKGDGMPEAKKTSMQWAANRKWSVMGDLVSKLGKVAASQNVAILLTSQTTTKLRGAAKAMLRAVMMGTAWESGVHNRIVFFRDWPPSNLAAEESVSHNPPAARYAEVLKATGKNASGSNTAELAVPFVIEAGGLRQLKLVSSSQSVAEPRPTEKRPVKRKLEEIADSEDEGDELGSDDDFGLRDEELLREAFDAAHDADQP